MLIFLDKTGGYVGLVLEGTYKFCWSAACEEYFEILNPGVIFFKLHGRAGYGSINECKIVSAIEPASVPLCKAPFPRITRAWGHNLFQDLASGTVSCCFMVMVMVVSLN